MASLNRQRVRRLRDDLDEVLREVGERHGLDLRTGSASWHTDGSTGSMKLVMNAIGADGEVNDPAAEEFKRSCALYGFAETDLGREFTRNGDTFRITGLVKRRPKYPVTAVNVANNRLYKFGHETVKAALAAEDELQARTGPGTGETPRRRIRTRRR